MDCSPPSSSVHGILQARILEWVAISFSRGSSQPRDRTQVSHIAGRCFNLRTPRQNSNQLMNHFLQVFSNPPTPPRLDCCLSSRFPVSSLLYSFSIDPYGGLFLAIYHSPWAAKSLTAGISISFTFVSFTPSMVLETQCTQMND